MKLIHAKDGEHYRRWVNLIPCVVWPGSAQFLSGRRRAAVIWFASYLLLFALVAGFLIYPKTNASVISMGPYQWPTCALWLVILTDALRHPIRRLRLKGWGLFLLVWLCVLILPMLGIRQFLIHPFLLHAPTMQPTIMGGRRNPDGHWVGGDHIFVNKLIYRFSNPQRGDVVVFSTNGIEDPFVERNTYFAKRVVGLPGETISIDPPYVVANGNAVHAPPILQRIEEGRDGFAGYSLATPSPSAPALLKSPSDKITLGPDEYFVLGDNTRVSLDSRYFGPITRSAIIGKAFYIYAPAERKGRIE